MSDHFFGDPATFQLSLWQQWSEWLPPYSDSGSQNWYNFTPIHLEFEHSPYKGSSEVLIIVLGFACCLRWIWNTHALDEAKEMREPQFASTTKDEGRRG